MNAPVKTPGNGRLVELQNSGHANRIRGAVMRVVDRANRMGQRVDSAKPFLKSRCPHGRR